MIDIFAIALTHGLLALAAWRLMSRDDLDEEVTATAPTEKRSMQAPVSRD